MEDDLYVFVGEGAGVPGLPHQITITQALELGVIEILKGAIANGNYAEAAQSTGESLSESAPEDNTIKRRR